MAKNTQDDLSTARPQDLMPLLTLLVGLVTTAVLYAGSVRIETARRAAEIDRLSSDFSRELASRVQSYVDTLPGLRVFSVLSRGASDLDFRQYLEAISLQRRFPGLALTFSADYLPAAELPNFVKQVRQDRSVAAQGHPDFQVRPAGERASYMVIRHISPFNPVTFGYDLYDPQQRYRGEVDAAARSGSYVATPPILLANDRHKPVQAELTSVVVRMAVYRDGVMPAQESERLAQLRGVVGVAFRTGELVSSVLSPEMARALQLRITDPQAGREGRHAEIFDSRWTEPQAPSPGAAAASLRIAVADREWQIDTADRRSPLGLWFGATPLLILFSGLALSAALTLLMRTLVRGRLLAERLVAAATADLRAQQLNLEEAQRIAHVGSWQIDVSAARLAWSREASRIYGVPEDKTSGSLTSFLAGVHPEDRAAVQAAIEQTVQQHSTYDLEHRVQRPDGREVFVHSRGEPIVGADGRVAFIRGSVQDTTEWRRAEATLEASESLYRLLFEHSLDSVLQTRADGSILKANPAACALFGLSEEALRERGRDGLADTSDPRLATLLAERARHGRAKGGLTMIKGDGTRFEAELSASVYTDQAGLASTSLVIRDVSAQRVAEAALRAKELAEQANRAKSEFVARMSHELRTPLNAVLGFAQVLQFDTAEPPSAAQRQRLQHIQRAGEHLLSLIEDLLDVSRIEAGALQLNLAAVAPLELAQQALRDVSLQAERHQVSLTIVAPAGPPPAVRADRVRLHQVLVNLLSNAIKYNRPGGSVELRFEPAESSEGAALDLVVADSGLGLDEQQMQQLFQPFNRLGREQTTIEGTGIGLVIARHLLELMGGSLRVSSRIGEGSQFTARLQQTRDADHSALVGEAALPALRGDLSGRVLYIDDDEGNRLLMQALFALRPATELRLAADGGEGLALAEAWVPDLLLIDLMMPGMSGLEVLQAVRQHDRLRATPCVAVSAHVMEDDITATLQAGFDGFVTKPLIIGKLLAEVDRLLAR